MKLTSIFTLILCLFIVTGHQSESIQKTAQQDIIEKISKSYIDAFLSFQKEVNKLVELTSKATTETDISSLQNQVTKTRFAFKKIEFIYDYNHTKYSHVFINGAPLLKFDVDLTGGNILEPNGLQTLDELIFSDEVSNQFKHINEVAIQLKEKVDFSIKIHIPTYLTNKIVIEALRSGIVRVFALGLTGFDTPGSVNAIEEAIVSMQSMEKTFSFFSECLNSNSKQKFKEINKLYKKGVKLLESNSDFDSFDRMNFLKKITNPLYESLLDFQILSNLETKQHKYHAQDYKSRNLFDEDFLDTDYYTFLVYLPLDKPKSIELGKTLFADPILSDNNKMSCLTCHNPTKGFADGLPKSKSNVEGKFTARNSPTIIDAGFSTKQFWDMRASNLERQVAHVIGNNLEFNTTFKEVIKKLNQDPEYVKLFEDAFGGISKKTINRRSVSNAIAAYVNSLKSFNSEFDQYVKGETKTYSKEAIDGFNLFMGKAACGTCHFAPVFNGTVPPFYIESESEVLGITLGLDSINPQKDLDLGRINNGLKLDSLYYFENSIKTVSLRNVELTAPYMHNGLFETLEEVMEFYNLGGGAGMGLDIEYQTLPDTRLNLSEKEMNDIILFLHTLTDTTGMTNIKERVRLKD